MGQIIKIQSGVITAFNNDTSHRFVGRSEITDSDNALPYGRYDVVAHPVNGKVVTGWRVIQGNPDLDTIPPDRATFNSGTASVVEITPVYYGEGGGGDIEGLEEVQRLYVELGSAIDSLRCVEDPGPGDGDGGGDGGPPPDVLDPQPDRTLREPVMFDKGLMNYHLKGADIWMDEDLIHVARTLANHGGLPLPDVLVSTAWDPSRVSRNPAHPYLDESVEEVIDLGFSSMVILRTGFRLDASNVDIYGGSSHRGSAPGLIDDVVGRVNGIRPGKHVLFVSHGHHPDIYNILSRLSDDGFNLRQIHVVLDTMWFNPSWTSGLTNKTSSGGDHANSKLFGGEAVRDIFGVRDQYGSRANIYVCPLNVFATSEARFEWEDVKSWRNRASGSFRSGMDVLIHEMETSGMVAHKAARDEGFHLGGGAIEYALFRPDIARPRWEKVDSPYDSGRVWVLTEIDLPAIVEVFLKHMAGG